MFAALFSSEDLTSLEGLAVSLSPGLGLGLCPGPFLRGLEELQELEGLEELGKKAKGAARTLSAGRVKDQTDCKVSPASNAPCLCKALEKTIFVR